MNFQTLNLNQLQPECVHTSRMIGTIKLKMFSMPHMIADHRMILQSLSLTPDHKSNCFVIDSTLPLSWSTVRGLWPLSYYGKDTNNIHLGMWMIDVAKIFLQQTPETYSIRFSELLKSTLHSSLWFFLRALRRLLTTQPTIRGKYPHCSRNI